MSVQVIAPPALQRTDKRNRHAAAFTQAIRLRFRLKRVFVKPGGECEILLNIIRSATPGSLANTVHVQVTGIVYGNLEIGVGRNGSVLLAAVE